MGFIRGAVSKMSFPSLTLGVYLFAASMTPSLIPRGPEMQGILGGLLIAIGYLLGRTISLVWLAADMPRLKGKLRFGVNAILALVTLCVLLWSLVNHFDWQNDLRSRMGIPPAEARYLLIILAVTVGTFALSYFVGAAIAMLFRLVRSALYRFMPARRANVLGVLVVTLGLFVVTRDGVFDRTVTALDKSYEAAQELFDNAPAPPSDPSTPGSAASLIDWAAMGRPGRDFVSGGPDAAAISAFTGRPAKDPIRVYVGRANAATAQARAELALAELKRLGAFERKVLIVTSPTGTGWMDPGSHDPVEYMHDGDIATVSAQYSFLQSPLALVLETRTGLEQATALLEVVHQHWRTLPPQERPRLYVHGLSLGAWSSMHALNLFRLLEAPIDGAFWAGPPFPSGLWKYLQQSRNPGSAWVLPQVGDGSLVRFASHYASPAESASDWGPMRIVFLQYSSDPIVFYDTRSLWRPPPWMTEPPAQDVSPYLRFIPIVTQFQLALDMALAFGTPAGHGHAYFARDYIPAWAEVTAPEDWNDADLERLKDHCDLGVKQGCRN